MHGEAVGERTVTAGAVENVASRIAQWRTWTFGLLLYIPVSGIPILMAAGHRSERIAAIEIKDFLFAIPAYGLFAVAWLHRGRWPNLRWLPLPLFAVLAVLVVGQAFNPTLANGMVGVIGAKVWLFYLPLLVLGYYFLTSRRDLDRLLKWVSLTAIIPATVGLIEAAVLYSGHASAVYSLYGAAAAEVTQDFVTFHIGGGTIHRLPSTFSFGQQYYVYVVTMSAIAYAWFRAAEDRRGRRLRCALWLYIVFAVFLSGQRGALLFFPLMVVAMFVLDHGLSRRASLGILIPVAVFASAAAVFGASPLSVGRHLEQTARAEFFDVIVHGTASASSMGWAGLGTGIDTNASRYAFGQDNYFPAVGGKWYEAWFIKTYLELGWLGLLTVLAIFVWIGVAGARVHRSLRRRELRAVSAGILAYFLWNILYCFKAQYLDIDPANVYFWFLLGILFSLPFLDPMVEIERPG